MSVQIQLSSLERRRVGEVETLSPAACTVRWDERGCAEARIELSEIAARDAQALELTAFPVLPYRALSVYLDGSVIWDGYVDSIRVDDAGRLTALSALGWTSAPLGYAQSQAGEPIDAVGNRLISQTGLPIKLRVEASVTLAGAFDGSFADWCERLRRVASDAGNPIEVHGIPERLVVVREAKLNATPDLIAPERFEREYPSARDIATSVTVIGANQRVVVQNPVLADLLGVPVQRTVYAHNVTSVQELQRLAMSELARRDMLPSCRWTGTEPWRSVTGELIPVWLLRPGMVVLVPRIGLLAINAVELDCLSRQASVVFGRPSTEHELLRSMKTVIGAASRGRSAVTWM